MAFVDLITNGRFELGVFEPWVEQNATITSDFSHSGFFAALLEGEDVNSFIYQYTPVDEGEGLQLLASIASVGELSSPTVSITVQFLDEDLNFLEYGLIVNIPAGRLPDGDENEWLEVYETTTLAPFGATQALVVITSLPEPFTADVIVDDVSLLTTVFNLL